MRGEPSEYAEWLHWGLEWRASLLSHQLCRPLNMHHSTNHVCSHCIGGIPRLTYFSYASSSSTQKQCRSAVLLTFCFNMAKYSWSGGGSRWGRQSKRGSYLLLSCIHFSAVPNFPKSPSLCPQLLPNVFSTYLPLINSMHLDDTSSMVMLPRVLNMTFCRKKHARFGYFRRTCAYTLKPTLKIHTEVNKAGWNS